MATATQRTRFWLDTGTSSSVFSADEVDDLFTEAAETYTDTATIAAYTRVIGLQRLMANAAKLTDYTQNQTSEKQSQVFDHLKALLAMWKDEHVTAVNNAASASGTARFGGMRRSPKRISEFPGGL